MDPLLSRRAILGALGAAAALGPTLADAQTYTADGVPRIDRYRWAWARAQLVLQPGLTWLDTASFGPTLRAVLVRTYRQLEEQSLDFRGFQSLQVSSLGLTRYPPALVCRPAPRLAVRDRVVIRRAAAGGSGLLAQTAHREVGAHRDARARARPERRRA